MAFTKYTKDTTIIGALGTNPAERALTTQEFKDKFDQFADEFVAWFNETHTAELDGLAGEGHTDETVKGIADALDTHKNETVQQVGGVHGFEVEEGTWTPIIDAETTSPSVSYTMQEGNYVRNGNIAHASFYIKCTISGGSGNTTITGLPFAADNYREAGNIGLVIHNNIATNYYGLYNGNALNEFRIMKDSRFTVQVSEINDGNTFTIQGSITYRI